MQALAADITGKEAALFVPSGTMSNLVSILSHCWGRGFEVLLGDQSHIYLAEQGGMSQVEYHQLLFTPNLSHCTSTLHICFSRQVLKCFPSSLAEFTRAP